MKHVLLAVVLSGGTTTIAAEAAAEWDFHSRSDPMDDSPILEISNMSNEAVTCGPRRPVRLVLTCNNAGTDLRFEHGCYTPGEYGHVDMDWRIGDQPVGGVRFYTTDPSDWFGYVAEGHHTALMMMEHDRFALRFMPLGEAEQTVSFDLRGMAEAVAPLRQACGW